MGVSSKHFYRFNYLKSEHWEKLRLEKIAQREGRCEICRLQEWNNDVHHIFYRGLWDVTVDDLAVLCRKCHDDVHDAMRKYPKLKSISQDAKIILHHFRVIVLHQRLPDTSLDAYRELMIKYQYMAYTQDPPWPKITQNFVCKFFRRVPNPSFEDCKKLAYWFCSPPGERCTMDEFVSFLGYPTGIIRELTSPIVMPINPN